MVKPIRARAIAKLVKQVFGRNFMAVSVVKIYALSSAVLTVLSCFYEIGFVGFNQGLL
jgi:hypothetical protein